MRRPSASERKDEADKKREEGRGMKKKENVARGKE